MFKENYQTLYDVAVMVIVLRRDTKHVGTPKQNNYRDWHQLVSQTYPKEIDFCYYTHKFFFCCCWKISQLSTLEGIYTAFWGILLNGFNLHNL